MNIRIVLDAAGPLDSVRVYTKSCPSIGILEFLHADQIEKPERRRDKESELPISLLGPWGQSRVNQRKWNAACVRFGGEIGPNLRFNENDPRWTDDGKSAAHDRPVIQRCVHNFDPSRRIVFRERESGCGGRGQDALQVGLELAQRVGQSQCNIYFAYTDCVHPRRSLFRQANAQLAVVNSQALSELFPVAAAPEHFDEIARQKEQKPNWPK